MMIVLPLYERYICILGGNAKAGVPYDVMAKDLQLASAADAKAFWSALRHGFCHTGMPFERDQKGSTLPKVGFANLSSWRPEFGTVAGQHGVWLDPLKFINYVMDRYRNDPALLTQHPDAPLLAIHVFTPSS
jgi:hypothetical protein